MQELSAKTSGRFARNMNNLLLAALTGLLIFLLVRIVFHDGVYALPLLALSAFQFALTADGPVLDIFCCTLLHAAFFVPEFMVAGQSSSFSPGMALFSLMALILLSLLCGTATARLRRERDRVSEQSSRERSVSELSAQLLTAADENMLFELTLRSLYSVTECPSVLFLPMENGAFQRVASYPEGLLLYPAEEAVQDCFTNDRSTGRGTGIFRETALRLFPVRAEDHVLAVAGLLTDAERPLTEYPLETVESLLMRAGIALDRLSFLKREQRILMEKETEHIRSDFLRSISHDFRTPLTGIIGACSTLEQTWGELEEADSRSLIRSVSEEAGWLLRMVENLLVVTRVGPSGHKLNKSLESVEEVLLEVLDMTRTRFPETIIHVEQPNEPLLVPMDPTLIVQVLSNLVENAVKYTDGSRTLELTVTEQLETVTFIVRDYGRGLSEVDLKNLFEPVNHRDGDSRHGMGLGLSICRSIIRAHDGTICGENAPGGGAIFTVVLPKEDAYA